MASLTSLTSTFLFSCLLLSLQLSLINGHGGTGDDTHDTDTPHLQSKALILVKIWCLIIFFFSTFIPGVSPYFFKWNEAFLLLGTQFAAGVFFGTAMMHFLDDATDTFGSLTSKSYPFSYMLACAGYLLTMLADVIIGVVASRSSGDKIRVEVEEGRTADDKEMEMCHNSPYLMRTTSVGDTILLIAALCFHSVFEGIAVGVADTEADAWKNMWTISLHKVFAAVAMGIALLRMLPKRPLLATMGYSFAFAISSPVGVGIGIALDATTQGRTADWLFAITMSLACGIFIYVAINHLIAKGFKPQNPCYFDTKFFKFFAVLLGVALMAVVMIWD